MSRIRTVLLSLLWSLIIVFGFYQVYLFINGYPLFSFAQKEDQKGYINLTSSAPFFIDGVFVGQFAHYLLYPLGTYTLCAEEVGYFSRCFPRVEVLSNEHQMLEMKDVVLLPESLTPRDVTSERVYLLPNKKGFFWYDSQKKQVFWIDQKSEQLRSFYPSFIPDEIRFDEKKEEYSLIKKNGKQKEESFLLDFSELSLPLLNIEMEDSLVFIRENSLWKWDKPDGGVGINTQSFVSFFEEKIEESFIFEGNSNIVLVFPRRVLLFSYYGEDFRFLFSKDSQTPVLFLKKNRQFWFLHDGKLKVVQL